MYSSDGLVSANWNDCTTVNQCLLFI